MSALKQPSENLVYEYDFSVPLGAETIESIVSVTVSARGGDSELIKSSQDFTGTTVQVEWSGGADGEIYLTTVKILDSAGQHHEIDGEIIVADLGFTLPKGITSLYLTAEEYVDRFSIEETVRLTDQRGTETIGVALGKALADAAARIEAHLASRYSLPLAETPEILKLIAADLARERLFTNHPMDEVTKRANQARSDLRDIAKGILELSVEGAKIEEGVADEPIVYAPDPVFTRERLSLFRGRMQ